MEPGIIRSLQTPIVAFIVTLSLRALLSFLETSITAMRLFKLKEVAAETDKYTSLFSTLEKNPHRVLTTILIASNLADVTAASLGTYVTGHIFEHFHLSSGLGFSIGIGLATIAILVFGEIIPKSLAKGHGEGVFRKTLWITNFVYRLFLPIAQVLTVISNFFIRLIGGKGIEESTEWVSSEKEIQFLIDYINRKGLLETDKTAMLQNIFELGQTSVKEVSVPAVDIISVDATKTSKETVNIFLKHRFTRLPVYEGKVDNIIGMVHLKDVFALMARDEAKQLKAIVRPILFVPESMKINQLLQEFRQQQMHIAIVLDEHGNMTGLVTLEDILEEIVGDISDEHERATERIIRLKQGGWLIDASTPLEEVEEELGIEFETEDSLTLGGFITEQLQHLPKKGDRTVYQNFRFQVQKATPKRVLQVLVYKEAATEYKKTDDDTTND